MRKSFTFRIAVVTQELKNERTTEKGLYRTRRQASYDLAGGNLLRSGDLPRFSGHRLAGRRAVATVSF